MATILSKQMLVVNFFILFCCFFSVSRGRVSPNCRVKAVSLGGWLVTEGWIKPSLFDGIPNKDFLDGTGLQFKSVTVGKYLSAERGGGTIIVANRTSASGWETFKLWRINASTFNFRVFNNQFVGLDKAGKGIDMVAVASKPGIAETFEIDRKSDDKNHVRIRASNGFFLQVKTEELVTADFKGNSTWADDDPSVFLVTTTGGYQGEFQVINGYGPVKAPLVMREHWRTFIVENDFKFISKNGLNSVRIPVGWWIASDPAPKPFVAGSLRALDNAFLWARKYGLKVIIDLHAAPGSQNPWEHSGTRDGSQEWGLTDANIQQTVAVIDFLAASVFAGLIVQQNIDFIQTNRSAQLALITSSNGPLTFVAEWEVSGATKEDYQRFAAAQLPVYGRATFGWAYWTLKNVKKHWSLEWMINNGYIKL